MPVMQEGGEAVEAGERGRRPVDRHCLCHGLKAAEGLHGNNIHHLDRHAVEIADRSRFVMAGLVPYANCRAGKACPRAGGGEACPPLRVAAGTSLRSFARPPA